MRQWLRDLREAPLRDLLPDAGHVLANGGLCLIYCPHDRLVNIHHGRFAQAIKTGHQGRDALPKPLMEARTFIERHLEDDPYAERVLTELDAWLRNEVTHDR